MKRTIVSLLACLVTTAVPAQDFYYSCKVCMFPPNPNRGGDGCDEEGKSYPLRIDESAKSLEWRGRKYS